jgi:hypothetical protein
VTLDELGRRAGAEVRDDALQGARGTDRLSALQVAARRRRRAGVVATAAVAALVLAVGWQMVGVERGGRTVPAGPRPTTTSTLPAGHARVELRIPVTVTLPKGWWDTPSGGDGVDFWSGQNGYGVSLSEGTELPARYANGPFVDPTVATDAHAEATWLASRSYLTTSGVVATTLDGRPAWRVDVSERPGSVEISAGCGGDYSPPPCIPLFIGPADTIAGIWGDGRIRYVLTDLPDGTTVQVSEWDFTGTGTGFDRSDQLVATMRFDAVDASG